MREEKVLWEPRRAVPIDARADVCVCGGGCTGVFAAVRSARLGCSVILCEEIITLKKRAFLCKNHEKNQN